MANKFMLIRFIKQVHLFGDGSAISNSSIAAMITSPDFSLFAGGDIEPPVQELLRRCGPR